MVLPFSPGSHNMKASKSTKVSGKTGIKHVGVRVRIIQLEKASSFILDFNCRPYRTKLNTIAPTISSQVPASSPPFGSARQPPPP